MRQSQVVVEYGLTLHRYKQVLGCSNVPADNTTDFYARYTSSVLCNAMIQNSITPCRLSGVAARPLCADTCAEYAQSEQDIVASNVCGTAGPNALTQIRADFTDCALPADSLTGTCVEGAQNQPDNCGFTSNLGGLCSYCSASSPNATDSCCVFSNATGRCNGVTLPVVASSLLKPVTITATQTATAGAPAASDKTATPVPSSHHGLKAGAIAGIVIGAVLGALALLALVIGGCLLYKRRRDRSPTNSIFNQPAPARSQPPMAFNDGSRDQERAGLALSPGARVARMSALEGSSSSERNGSPPYVHGAWKKSIDDAESTPDSRLAPPPKRSGSLSSASQLAAAAAVANETSPSSNDEQYTSPESHGQSEQLNFFKDYYSQDEIHPGDLVSTLWAYEPRAADEFHLERGNMIKVLGIWDDGWATGVRVSQKAEDWRPEGRIQRDSGMSNGSSRPPDTADSEVKAFPLVCVCLPQHWRKTIEGDSTEGTGGGPFSS